MNQHFETSHDSIKLTVTSILSQIKQQIPKPRKRLHCTRQYLVRRQHKPKAPRIPQLARERILRFANIGDVVDAAAGHLVDGGAYGAGFEDGAVDGFDGGDGALGQGLVFGVVGGYGGAGVAVCWGEVSGLGGNEREICRGWGEGGLTGHEELRVGMVIDKELQTSGRFCQRVDVVGKADVLWSR